MTSSPDARKGSGTRPPERVYLSGGMEYARDEGRDWRQSIQHWLEEAFGCTVFNPNVESERFFSTYYPSLDFRKLKQDDIGAFRSIVSCLVDNDCREIAERSDMVICYWDEAAARGAGTKGELTIARFFRKPVYLVTAVPQHEIPGWVLGCVSAFFSDFEALKRFLHQTFDGLPQTGQACPPNSCS